MRTGLPLAALLACAAAHAQFVTPGTNLVADGIPPVPNAIVDKVRAYSDFWPQRALSWHPQKREMLISRRAGDASQVFRLEAPGAKPEQYTSFADPVGRASYPPAPADHFLFVKDEGGNERYQLWRYDVQTRNTARLTDPSKRHSSPVWALDGRVAYTAVAVGAQRDSSEVRVEIRVMDPRDPEVDQDPRQERQHGQVVEHQAEEAVDVAQHEPPVAVPALVHRHCLSSFRDLTVAQVRSRGCPQPGQAWARSPQVSEPAARVATASVVRRVHLPRP